MDEEIINKRKFNFSDFFKKNKFKIFSTIALIIVTIFILIILNEYQKKRNIDISEKFNTAKILIEKKTVKSQFYEVFCTFDCFLFQFY